MLEIAEYMSYTQHKSFANIDEFSESRSQNESPLAMSDHLAAHTTDQCNYPVRWNEGWLGGLAAFTKWTYLRWFPATVHIYFG